MKFDRIWAGVSFQRRDNDLISPDRREIDQLRDMDYHGSVQLVSTFSEFKRTDENSRKKHRLPR